MLISMSTLFISTNTIPDVEHSSPINLENFKHLILLNRTDKKKKMSVKLFGKFLLVLKKLLDVRFQLVKKPAKDSQKYFEDYTKF